VKPKVNQYIIAPVHGLTGVEMAEKSFLSELHRTMSAKKTLSISAAGHADIQLRIVDSIGENKPKLIECAPENLAALRASNPAVRVIPVVYFKRAVVRHQVESKVVRLAATAAAKAAKITVTVVAQGTNKPVAGVTVVAFTDFANKQGAQGKTNSQGKVALSLGAASKKIERLYLYPTDSFWPGLLKGLTLKNGASFTLDATDLSYVDCVRFFYPDSTLTDVRV
jgi:subtilisin